jgi:hypothetical protein
MRRGFEEDPSQEKVHDGSLLEFQAKDQPYFGKKHLHSSRATPCSRASQSTNRFQISALGPRALVIPADEGFSVLPISAFEVTELFLTSKQR